MNYTTTEQKFINLMLDKSAQGNEVNTSAEMLVKSLRKRNVLPADMMNGSASNAAHPQLASVIAQLDEARRNAANYRTQAETLRIERNAESTRANKLVSTVKSLEADLSRLQAQMAGRTSSQSNASTEAPRAANQHVGRGGDAVFNFGRHTGKTVRNTSPSYLHWCVENVTGRNAWINAEIQAFFAE
jgi:hypothetical protein